MIAELQTGKLAELTQKIQVEEQQLQGATKDTLCNLAEAVLTTWGYSKAEYDQAIITLATYHLAHLADKTHPSRARKMIAAERARSYEHRCHRCGLIITAEKSIRAGYGHICRRKLGVKTETTEQLRQDLKDLYGED